MTRTPLYRSARRCGSLLSAAVLLCLAASCSSYSVHHAYNKDGSVSETHFTNSRGVSYDITYRYDKDKGAVTVERLLKKSGLTIDTITLKFNAAKQVVVANTSSLVDPVKGTKDVVVESYSFNRVGRLARFETSFKSSYSISKNKTALITTRYDYASGNLSEISVAGGTFRKNIRLSYVKGELGQIEYSQDTLDWKKRQFIPAKKLTLIIDDGEPVRITDTTAKTDITARTKVEAIYREEGIDDLLRRAEYSLDYTEYLKHVEKRLTAD